MKNYELYIIADGESTPARVKTLRQQIEKMVALFEGKVAKVEDWGKKAMAYKIGKSTTGYYLLFHLELGGKAVKSLNSKLKMEPEVLRYLVLAK